MLKFEGVPSYYDRYTQDTEEASRIFAQSNKQRFKIRNIAYRLVNDKTTWDDLTIVDKHYLNQHIEQGFVMP